MQTAGGVTAALAALVLLGWTLDIPALKSVAPDFVPMLPATALGLAVGAVSLILASSRRRNAERVAFVLAWFVIYLGAHSLAESLFGLDGWLRHLLFPAAADGHANYDYTVSQVAAASFVLLGLCTLLAGAKSRFPQWAFVVCATSGLLIAMVSSLAYLFGADALLDGGGLQPIAVHTAAAFVLLFAGMLVLRADLGWLGIVAGSQPAEIAGRSLLALVVVLPVISAWMALQGGLLGLYGPQFRLALMTTLMIILLSALVLLYTRRIVRLHEAQLHVAEALHESERRFRQAAEQENRRKDEFLATLGHELRNPLAPISAAAQVLGQQASVDPGLQRISSMLKRQTRNMTYLIDDLMDVSRIALGGIELRRSRVLLSSIVESALEASRPNIEAAGHSVSLSLPEDVVEVDADAMRLSQVVLNLLNNAAKFTPDGGEIHITVETRGADAVVRVRDTGIGIDPRSAPDIFSIFAQVRKDGARGAGLGIGLALTRTLMELHGGRIEVHSDGIGKGSEFVIAMPRLAPARDVEETAAPDMPVPNPASGNPGCRP